MGNTVEFNASVDADERTKIKNEAFERFMVVLLLRASDQTTYGKMQDDYRMAYANTRDEYPKSVKTMVDVMRQVKVTTSQKKSSPSDRDKSNSKKDTKIKPEKSFV